MPIAHNVSLIRKRVNQTELLDRFQHALDVSEKTAPMQYSYQRITPYIIETEQPGHTYSLIIYNVESELWYAQNLRIDNSFAHLHEHRIIRPNDVVFDLGCNAGFTTCWYALTVGPRGKVYGFDPFPWNAIATRFNAELNGLDNVTAFQVGIGAKEEKITLSLHDSKIASREGPLLVSAQIYPLLHYRSLRPNVLKIDIEGAEFELSETDLSAFDKLRFCVLELHPEYIEQRGLSPHQCLDNLMRQGFEIRTELGSGNATYDPCQAPPIQGNYYLLRQANSPFWGMLRRKVEGLRFLKPGRRLRDVIRERDKTIREREAVTRQRERVIRELEHDLRTQDRVIAEMETKLRGFADRAQQRQDRD